MNVKIYLILRACLQRDQELRVDGNQLVPSHFQMFVDSYFKKDIFFSPTGVQGMLMSVSFANLETLRLLRFGRCPI